MKINGLHIDGFGVWKDLSLEEFDDGLTVIYGPNEAGKTTLLEFIRSMMYGYRPAGRKYLPPVEGGTGGGSLQIEAGGRFRLQRRFDAGLISDSKGNLLLSSPDRGQLSEHRLGDMLGGVDQDVFRNVFAIGLREIQELGTLGDTEAADMLYRLAAGMDRVSLLDVVRELRTSRRRLLDPDSGKGQLVELRAEWQRLRNELEERTKLTHRYGRLASERMQVDRELQRLETEADDLERQARLVELALSLSDRWTHRADLDAQLTALGPVREMPEGAIDRLDELNTRLAQHRERGQAIKRERERLKTELAELKINANLWRQSPRIEALREQQSWIEGLQRQVAELEAQVGQLDEGLHSQRNRIGGGENEFAGGDLPTVSSSTIAALRPAARSVRQCREQLEEVRREGDEAKQTAEALSRQIDNSLGERGHTELTAALDNLGGRVAQLRRRRQIDERLLEMTSYQEDLDQQNRRLIDGQLLPLPILAFFGLLFVLGGTLVVFGLVGGAAAWVTVQTAWKIAMAGAVGVVGASIVKVAVERTNHRRAEACQRQVHLLGTQIDQTRRERDALDATLAPDGVPLENRLEATERELATLEELVPLEGRRNTARQDAHAALGRVNLAEQELKTAVRRWQQALRSVGLPSNLQPRQVKQLGGEFDQVRQLSRRVEGGREELAARRRELNTLHDRVRQLVRDCGVELHAVEPMEQLDELAASAADQDSRLARRKQIRRRAHELKRKLARDVSAVRSLNRRRQSLLREVDATDEQQFRGRALEIARAEVLQGDRDAVAREIRAALGDTHSEDELAEQFEGSTPKSLESRLEELLEKHEAVETRRKERLETRGRLGEQLRLLADNREMVEKRMELAAVEKRLEDAAQRWRVLAVTSQTLDSIRNDYERSRQPEALREASGYLERFTEGRYRRVWTPLGDDVLQVEDAEKNALPVEVLSRGTREQLFLSLRLALANCYARRGVSLPLVLDDVLVNFDAGRAKAAARTLRDFADQGHQLLVFTCHEHIVKLFRPLKVRITELPSRSGASLPAIAVEAPPPKKRSKPKKASPPPPPPAPEPEPEPIVAEFAVEELVIEEPKPTPTAPPQPKVSLGTYSVIEPPVVVLPPIEDPFELEYELIQPFVEEVPEEAEEDSVDPILDECALINETEVWVEEAEPEEEEELWDELPEPEEPEEEEPEEEEFEEEDELDEYEYEYEEEEDTEVVYSEPQGVFDADYYDSREAVDELDEEDGHGEEDEYEDEEEEEHEDEVLEDDVEDEYEEEELEDEADDEEELDDAEYEYEDAEEDDEEYEYEDDAEEEEDDEKPEAA